MEGKKNTSTTKTAGKIAAMQLTGNGNSARCKIEWKENRFPPLSTHTHTDSAVAWCSPRHTISAQQVNNSIECTLSITDRMQ